MSEELQAVSNDAPLEGVSNAPEVTAEVKPEEKAKTGDPRLDDPWPESARNAVNRREKALAKERAQLAQYRRELNELRAAQEKAAKDAGQPKEPNENDFDTYGDYLKAVAKFRPQEKPQETVDPKTIHEQALQQARVQMHYEQRKQAVIPAIEKAMTEHPELAQLEEEFADVIDSAPEPVLLAFLDSENPAAAFYALAKEGKLEQLAHMPPTQMAYAIAQAELRGTQMMKASKVSKAPTPIQGVKGASSGSRSLGDFKNVDDVMKWVKS